MKRSISLAVGLLLAAFGAGCAPDEGGDGYSDADLARYKAALPARSNLQVTAPVATSVAAFGTTSGAAVYPAFAVPIALQVNGLIGGTLDIVEFVSSLEPTLYDSEDLEFWWGPIPDGDSPIQGDHYSLYIHDRIDDPEYDPMSDLRYEFAVIRGVGNDVSTLTPIIYGGGTPVEGDVDDDHGIGVMLYDFDNNVEFEDLHNPAHGPLTSGRMATIFAKGPDENNANAEVTYVVAAFRDFLPEDAAPGAQPADVDYFWGKFQDAASQFDFLDFGFQADLDENNSAIEDFAMKLAFYNEGIGRAGVQVSGGDVAPNVGDVTECWDAALQQDYLGMVVSSNGNVVASNETGSEALCVWNDAEFDAVPDRGDAAALVTLIGTIADAGMPSDLPEEND